MRTSYVGTYLELVHPNGTTETVLHNSTEVTFTDLTPATDYSLNVTFIFVGDFMTAESSLSESTQDGGKSHDMSHDLYFVFYHIKALR